MRPDRSKEFDGLRCPNDFLCKTTTESFYLLELISAISTSSNVSGEYSAEQILLRFTRKAWNKRTNYPRKNGDSKSLASARSIGNVGVHISASVRGEPCARITVQMALPGIIFHTTTRGRALIAGTKTGSPGFVIVIK